MRFAVAAAGLGLVPAARALCPICTVAVGAGVGLSRWLGVDDTVTGLWIGGLIVSLVLWTSSWLDARGRRFHGRASVVALVWFLSALVPLYLAGMFGLPLNSIWGLDKLLVGIAVGSVAFYLGARGYEASKAANAGHARFPFQKVVMPLAPLAVLSVVFYYATR
jgi:hypothetical protein